MGESAGSETERAAAEAETDAKGVEEGCRVEAAAAAAAEEEEEEGAASSLV
jgi:hypothetical protein